MTKLRIYPKLGSYIKSTEFRASRRPTESEPLVSLESVFFKDSITESLVQPGVEAADGLWEYLIINDN